MDKSKNVYEYYSFPQIYIWKYVYDVHIKHVHIRLTAVWNEIVPVSPFIFLSLTYIVSETWRKNEILGFA